ncbi:hypothetical protein SR1949_54110 [Sphaerospermopsis reniformis]|uniref:KANL3/Tex30 alpha/beta hydrolase-like domain-containing protein n=1 Tax=Sphaerospermopsis reniformis TaxID=531300 RepID=A0A480A5J0_9CYAN|nr:hypothetical protein SR1949_54110 [Sphaerospermopsis reniformis]
MPSRKDFLSNPYLTEDLKIKPEQIIVFGRSVGGGSAIDLAARKPIAGLIIESTFTSAFRVVVPFPILPFDKFNNLEKIKKVKVPVLVMHGKLDDIVPFEHGEKLFAAVTTPKLYLWVEDANHNDFFEVAQEKYGQKLREFAELVSKN